MSILIEKKGVFDTIQDLGRNGFRKFGVNPNGVMDTSAARLINTLLGNIENEAVLEMHFPAATIRFEQDALIALGGADFGASIEDKPIGNWQTHHARKGSILRFERPVSGNRCYLAVKGGFVIEEWLASASTNTKAGVGGIKGRNLISTDRIPFKIPFDKKKIFRSVRIARSAVPAYADSAAIRFIAGAEYRNLTALSEHLFAAETYLISKNSDRMGFRLKGKNLIFLSETEIISTAVNFGTIQLLPNGQMIILMADHQTTGGYPKIGHIIKQDLPLIAQMGDGDEVRFNIVSIKEAEDITLGFEKDLRFLKMGLRFNPSG